MKNLEESGELEGIPEGFDYETEILNEGRPFEEIAENAAREELKVWNNGEEPDEEQVADLTKEFMTPPVRSPEEEEPKLNWVGEFSRADAIKDLRNYVDGEPTEEQIDEWLAEYNAGGGFVYGQELHVLDHRSLAGGHKVANGALEERRRHLFGSGLHAFGQFVALEIVIGQ